MWVIPENIQKVWDVDDEAFAQTINNFEPLKKNTTVQVSIWNVSVIPENIQKVWNVDDEVFA